MKLEKIYERLKPGQCYRCGKGPIIVVSMEQNVYTLDNDGKPIDVHPGEFYSNIGVCKNCGTVLGTYDHHALNGFTPHFISDEDINFNKSSVGNIFGLGSSNNKVVIL